jgi:hypothetical protein
MLKQALDLPFLRRLRIVRCSCHKAPYQLQAQAGSPNRCQDQRSAVLSLALRALFVISLVPSGRFFYYFSLKRCLKRSFKNKAFLVIFLTFFIL